MSPSNELTRRTELTLTASKIPTRCHDSWASRILYRRLAGWVWFPFIALLMFDVLTSLNTIIFPLHSSHLHVHTPHAGSFWDNLLLNLLILAGVEFVVVCCAGLIVRRRFDRDARRSAPELSEPLSLTFVDDVDSLEFARRNAERAARAPSLAAHRDRPSPSSIVACARRRGPSRTVVVERRGRFGLPPVFTSVDRLGGGGNRSGQHRPSPSLRRRGRIGPASGLLERLIANTYVQPAPSGVTTTVGSWANRQSLPRHRRTPSRAAPTANGSPLGRAVCSSWTGLINVIVTVSPPLRSRLHAVQAILPLGVAQSAAVFTAVAGIAMIMMGARHPTGPATGVVRRVCGARHYGDCPHRTGWHLHRVPSSRPRSWDS